MLYRLFMKGKYYWHLTQQHHHELLLKDCNSEEMKVRQKVKVLYHHSKVIELFYKMNVAFE